MSTLAHIVLSVNLDFGTLLVTAVAFRTVPNAQRKMVNVNDVCLNTGEKIVKIDVL